MFCRFKAVLLALVFATTSAIEVSAQEECSPIPLDFPDLSSGLS